MALADDIAQARTTGRSDGDILTALQGYAPQYSDDIAAAQKAGHSASDIVNAVVGYDSEYGPEAQKSTIAKVTDPFRYGAANVAQGTANTLDQTGEGGTTSNALASAAKAVAPDNYTPAHVTLDPHTWGDVPKAIAESSPGLAEDIAAGGAGSAAGATLGSVIGPEGTAAGALLGGGAGAIASYASRNFGDDATQAAIARTGNPHATPNTEDYARAMAASAVGGLASRLGFKGALGDSVKAADGSFASQIIPQVAKSAVIDAGTSSANTAAAQALLQGHIDPSTIGGSAITGAVTGAGLRGLASYKDLTAGRQFGDLSPEDALPVAQKLVEADQSNGGDGSADSPSRSYDAITKVRDDLGVQAYSLANDPNVTQHLAALQDANQLDDTRQTLARVQTDISKNRTPAPADLQQLSDSLGAFPHGSDLVETLKQQGVVNKIIGLGNLNKKAGTFTGGITSSPAIQAALNPFSPGAELIDAGGAIYGAAGRALSSSTALPAVIGGMTLPATQGAAYAALRGIDAFTGRRSPVDQFLGRFGDGTSDTPDVTTPAPVSDTTGPRSPAFLDVLAQTRAAAKLQQVADNAPTEADTKLADIVRTSRLMRASDTVEARRQSAIHTGVRQQAALMSNSQDGPTSAATSAIRVAKLRASLANQSAPAVVPQPVADAMGLQVAAMATSARHLVDAAQAIHKVAAPASVASNGPVVTTPIVHQDGTRQQANGEIRQQLSSVQNGVHTRADARRDIVTAAQQLPLSPEGKSALAANTDGVLRQVFNVSQPAHARGLVEGHLDNLSPSDAQIIRSHLLNHVDPSTGHTFYSTWE